MSMTPQQVMKKIVAELEVPRAAYDLAVRRYEDLGAWLHDKDKSQCASHDPKIYPQGSFRLGTVVRPITDSEYDLDLSCVLQQGVDRSTHTQQQLKTLLGNDLEKYRKEKGINDPLEEKRRCWRLNYQDSVGYHMDAVPAVLQDAATKSQLQERMVKLAGADDQVAHQVSQFAVSLTDLKSPDYRRISDTWLVGNQEGFARWFELRMKTGQRSLEERARMEKVANIEELPTFWWKSPLQHCIQILKRHRDICFARSPDAKPISVIITTLASHAYGGQDDILEALIAIGRDMRGFIRDSVPRVPNPVNPQEDYADKWDTSEGRRLDLEGNCKRWLTQVQVDIERVASGEFDAKWLRDRLGVVLEGDIGRAPPAPVVSVTSSGTRPWHAS